MLTYFVLLFHFLTLGFGRILIVAGLVAGFLYASDSIQNLFKGVSWLSRYDRHATFATLILVLVVTFVLFASSSDARSKGSGGDGGAGLLVGILLILLYVASLAAFLGVWFARGKLNWIELLFIFPALALVSSTLIFHFTLIALEWFKRLSR